MKKQVQDLLAKCAAYREADKIAPVTITLERQEAEQLAAFLNSSEVAALWGFFTSTKKQWNKMVIKVLSQTWQMTPDEIAGTEKLMEQLDAENDIL